MSLQSNESRRFDPAKAVASHAARAGIVALAVAVAHLVLLRGADPRIALVFGFPPALAAFAAQRGRRSTRIVAWGFLTALGLGAAVSHVPELFPDLGGVAQHLAPHHNRMITWYVGVWLIWIAGVLPVHAFCGSLRSHWRGESASFSRFTCYLGLATAALSWVGVPGLLALLGFWPIV